MSTLREDDICAALDSIALVEAKLTEDSESYLAIVRAAEDRGDDYLSHLLDRTIALATAFMNAVPPVAVHAYLDGYRTAVLDDELAYRERHN